MRVEFALYTPETAQVALDTMPNRQRALLQRAQVERIARDMTAGNFAADNGQTIKFNADGRMIDGQHRMLAIIQSEMPQWLLTVYGIDDHKWQTIDTGGRIRHPHQVLRARGVTEANRTAASIRFLWLYENGLSFNAPGAIKPTLAERDQIERHHPAILHIGALIRQYRRISSGTLCCLAYLLTSKYGPTGEEFLRKLREGLFSSADDPVFLLNRRFMASATSRSLMSPGETAHLVRVAFRAHLSGSRIKYLSVRDPNAPLKI